MQMVRKCKKQLSEQLEQKMFTAIEKKLNTVIVFSNLQAALLERNINTLVTLKNLNYFNTLKRREQLERYSQLVVVQFQNICNNGGNVDVLSVVMQKLFTTNQMRKTYLDVQQIKSLVQNPTKSKPK
jgi:hypothetical protein